MNRYTRLMLWGLLVLISSLNLPVQAQALTVLQLAVPEWQRGWFTESLFSDFYAAYPDVRVEIVTDDPRNGYFFFDANEDNIANNLNNIAARVSSADVLSVNPYNFGIEATRAGAYLDLDPLINGDSTFNAGDFYPAVWDAYQWDRGIWAVPLGMSPVMLVYNADAFDAAGIAYPTASWTMDDVAHAARMLTVYGEDGSVTVPGLSGFDIQAFIVSLTGQPLLDRSIFPNEPRLDTPELRMIVEKWEALASEGVYQTFGDFDPSSVPMSIDRLWRLNGFMNDGQSWQAALLPGGRAGLQVEGLAVSAGTQHPELAYALVKYLSSRPEITVQNPNVDYPARQSMVGLNAETPQNPPRSPQAIEAVELALQNGIPTADVQFYSFLSFMFQTGTGPESAAASLDGAQQIASSVHGRISNALANSPEIAVVPPQAPVVLQPGQSALNIRIETAFANLPNPQGWEDYVDAFVTSEPTVGSIDLQSGVLAPGEDATTPDCWYSVGNALAYLNPDDLMSLDPFMDADPSFNSSDFLPGTLEQMQNNNQTWGYPVAIQPVVMTFNREMFSQDGIPTPDNGWTIEQLVQAMRALKETGKYDGVLFNYNGGMSYMMQLIAAFGGNPVDTSTMAITYDLTNPAHVEAIRQALDLAREGLITYRALGEFGGGGIPDEHPITVTNYNSMVYHLQDQIANDWSFQTLEYVTFPAGSQYAPAAFVVGAGYISATSQNPEACYRFIAGLGEHPELILGMPVLASQVIDPVLGGLLGEPTARFYRQFAQRLQAPNALIIADESSGTFATYIEHIWIGRAFDRYVLENADLAAELSEAQRLIDGYRECLGSNASLTHMGEMLLEEREALYETYRTCAVDVDPLLATRFGQ